MKRFLLPSCLMLSGLLALQWIASASDCAATRQAIKDAQHEHAALKARAAGQTSRLAARASRSADAQPETLSRIEAEEQAWNEAIESTLASLKEARAKNPPPHRTPKVPRGTYENGIYFPELIRDPDYRAAVRTLMRQNLEHFTYSYLSKVDPLRREKALELLIEQQLLPLDTLHDQLQAGAARPQSSTPETRKRFTEINAELKEVLGEDAKTPQEAAIANGSGDWRTSKIKTRLSYSEAPLSPAQAAGMEALYQRLDQEALKKAEAWMQATQRGEKPTGPRPGNNANFAGALIEGAKAILSEAQLDALRELAAEEQAYEERRRLPKL